MHFGRDDTKIFGMVDENAVALVANLLVRIWVCLNLSLSEFWTLKNSNFGKFKLWKIWHSIKKIYLIMYVAFVPSPLGATVSQKYEDVCFKIFTMIENTWITESTEASYIVSQIECKHNQSRYGFGPLLDLRNSKLDRALSRVLNVWICEEQFDNSLMTP